MLWIGVVEYDAIVLGERRRGRIYVGLGEWVVGLGVCMKCLRIGVEYL